MQAAARGMLDRASVALIKRQRTAAVKMQAAARGMFDRASVALIKRRRTAAVKIQSRWRGAQVRQAHLRRKVAALASVKPAEITMQSSTLAANLEVSASGGQAETRL